MSIMTAQPHDRQDNFRAPLDPYGARAWTGKALGTFGARAGSAEYLELRPEVREPALIRTIRQLARLSPCRRVRGIRRRKPPRASRGDCSGYRVRRSCGA